jgi:hypothetical protein
MADFIVTDIAGSGFKSESPWNLSVYIITIVGGSPNATCHKQLAALLRSDKPLDVLLPGNARRVW